MDAFILGECCKKIRKCLKVPKRIHASHFYPSQRSLHGVPSSHVCKTTHQVSTVHCLTEQYQNDKKCRNVDGLLLFIFAFWGLEFFPNAHRSGMSIFSLFKTRVKLHGIMIIAFHLGRPFSIEEVFATC